jgi:hypothetical protein
MGIVECSLSQGFPWHVQATITVLEVFKLCIIQMYSDAQLHICSMNSTVQ